MELLSIETLRSGLISGAAVALGAAVTVVAVGALAHDSDMTSLASAGTWAAISVVFGIIAAMAFVVLNGTLSLGPSGYLLLAIGAAVALTALEFVPIYGNGTFAPHWQVYAVLNFVFAAGFGYLVPKLLM